MIRKLLGEPDQLKKNPHHKSGPPMRLYDRNRVEVAEQSPEFTKLLGKASERGKRGSEQAVITAQRQEEAFREAKRRAFAEKTLKGHDGVNQILESGRQYRVQKCGKEKGLVRLFGARDLDYIGITNLNEAAEKRLLEGADEVMSRKAINW